MEIWAGPIGFTVVLTQPGLTGSHAKKGNRPHHQHPLHKAELAGELPLPGVLQFPWNRSTHHMGVQLEIRPLCPGPPPATTHSLSFCPVPQIKRCPELPTVRTCLCWPLIPAPDRAGNCGVLSAGRQGQAITLVTQYDIHLVHAIEEQISEWQGGRGWGRQAALGETLICPIRHLPTCSHGQA